MTTSSAINNGLVSTLVTTDTAQDITGVKTFPNGMKGRTDGGTPTTGYIGEKQSFTASFLNTNVGTWQLAPTLGTPTKGTYLFVLEVVGTPGASTTGIAAVANTSNSAAGTGVITQSQGACFSNLTPYATTLTTYTADGVTPLYLWLYSAGAVATLSGTVRLIRIA
jgi:hypothetical protein